MNAKNFRIQKRMPYQRRKFMGGVPGSKIVKFTMGNTSKDFSFRVELVNLGYGQIRHNSLEAARIAANRQLELKLGKDNYFMKVVPFPHNVLREHKRVNVAQADRFQEGMKRPYGKPTGVAARVNRNDSLIVIDVEKTGIDIARDALERAKDKFPVQCRVTVTEKAQLQP